MTLLTRGRLGALSGIALAAAGLLATAPAQAETIFGLTSTNALVTFDSATPTLSGPAMGITGLLGANESLIGIDSRPATGALYGLSDAGNLYILNTLTGVATFASALNVSLSGSTYGVDFNPVPDRLRITTSSGQNLRVNVETGAATVDGALNGATTSLAASAYTNSFSGATTTTLYGISSITDTLYTQNPPNAGTQVAVGALGVDTTGAAGFDISGVTGVAYASFTNGDNAKSSLYTINLGSGAATLIGAFGMAGNTSMAPPLLDIAVAAVPEPSTYAMLTAGLLMLGSLARRRRNKA